MSVAALGRLLTTDLQHGLSADQVRERQKAYGPNALPESRGPGFWTVLMDQFKDFMVLVLLGATVVSFALGEIGDALTILSIVLLNAALGSVQEFRAERSLQALKRLSAPECRVVRGGREQVIPARDLVPGDLVRVEAGDRVPADLRLLETFGLECEEASLTGESLPVSKRADWLGRGSEAIGDRINCLFMGTTVTRGRATGVVFATGRQTQIGEIAGMLADAQEPPTPLQLRLEQLGKGLLAAAALTVTAVFIAGVAQGRPILDMFLTGVSLAVAAIPEGLPAVVTIALALGVQRMIRRNGIVRHLPAVETLGCVTTICSDKTGTLTENQMTVTRIWLPDGSELRVEGSGYAPYGRIQNASGKPVSLADQDDGPAMPPVSLELLSQVAVFCNHAEVQEDPEQGWVAVGDPTEAALLVLAHKAGASRAVWQRQYRLVAEIPFDSDRRRMSVAVRRPDGGIRVLVKGAPEAVLPLCHTYLPSPAPASGVGTFTGLRPLRPADRQRCWSANTTMARAALRVLALAYRDLPASALPAVKSMDAEMMEHELTLIGLVGMIDPPRPQAVAAIRTARRAGIRPIMVTGDHLETARAIASQIGLADGTAPALTGPEVENFNDAELQQAVAMTSVFARVAPRHKLRIVKALKAQGQVVAMTGDGVNDAPAVQEADIGISMGRAGTEVTKEASDMVLADDNFATIVAAIEEGRAIYDNIRKFIRYLLSCNAGEVITMFVAALAGWPLPLVPIQILWMNLVTDGLPAVALGVEPPEPGTMDRPPRPPAEGVFARGLGWRVLGRGLVIALSTLAVFALALRGSGNPLAASNLLRAQTMAFHTLVFSQLFFVFQCRSERASVFTLPLLGNPSLLAAVTVSAGMQLVTTYVPRLASYFHVVPLSSTDWQIVFLGAIWPLALDALGQLIRAFLLAVGGKGQRLLATTNPNPWLGSTR